MAKQVPVSATTVTLVAADTGKCVAITASITVPNTVFAAGDVVSIYNNSAANLTITQGVGHTLRQAGSPTPQEAVYGGGQGGNAPAGGGLGGQSRPLGGSGYAGVQPGGGGGGAGGNGTAYAGTDGGGSGGYTTATVGSGTYAPGSTVTVNVGAAGTSGAGSYAAGGVGGGRPSRSSLVMKYLLLIFLAGCSLNTNIRMQCDGKCDVEMSRDATVKGTP